MKKILLVLAALGLVLCLSGCAKVYSEVVVGADGIVTSSLTAYYQDEALYYAFDMTAEEYFGKPLAEIPVETIDGELYYKDYYYSARTLGEYVEDLSSPIAGMDEYGDLVQYSVEEKDGLEYCTIVVAASEQGASTEDLARMLGEGSSAYEGLQKIVMDIQYTFENGLVSYTCAPADEKAIEVKDNSITIHEMKLSSGEPVTFTGIIGSIAPEEEQPFTDVRKDSYFADAVKWALANNVTKGTSATTFNPYGECNRAQVVTFLWNAAGQPEPTKAENPFTDVKASDWYYKAVLWAVENNITSGTSATTFSPLNTCQNSHMVTFLWNASGKPGKTETSAHWWDNAYAWAEENGMFDGVPSVDVPDISCRRCNIVMLLMNQYVK